MGNLAKGSPLIKKLIFFVSYLTRAESHEVHGEGFKMTNIGEAEN